MTGDANKYSDAKRFCESQHSAGRVIWETQEEYLDLKYIVGIWPGKDKSAFTGLHNQMASVCNSASECDGKLVNLNVLSFLQTLLIVLLPGMEPFRHRSEALRRW